MKRLTGRTAVVTGAGSGIGRALVQQLIEAGCHVAAVDIRGDRLAELAEAVGGGTVRVSTHVVDVSDRAAMEALPAAVLEVHDAVHLVINNAGVTVSHAFKDHSLDDWEWLIGINLWGVVYGCHVFLPHLMEVDEAHIVNISSVFGIAGILGQSSYCTSKFGVRGLSECLWEELRPTHVGVTVVHPGGVDTRIVADARIDESIDREEAKARFASLGISPRRAAGQILRAVRRDQPRLRITREAYLMDWLRRLLPVWGNQLINWALLQFMGLGEAHRTQLEDYRSQRRELGFDP